MYARTRSADAAKRNVRLWQEADSTYMFVLRGRLVVPSTSESKLVDLLRFVVSLNKRVLKMITPPPITKTDIAAFRPPVEQAATAVSRVSEVHFRLPSTCW